MRALVTGGAGFIGSNIAHLLLNKEYKVKVIDNLSSGYFENIGDLIDNPNFEFVKIDINNFDNVNAEMKDIDVVFHLAASVGRQRSIDNPQLDSMTNLVGTINILEAMKKNNVRKIVYSSSAAIFGEIVGSSIDESHIQNADTPYGVSKLAAEKMILAYHKLYPNINAVCLRYFNIYGKNQRYSLYGNVIPIFAERIYTKKPIIIYGDGQQTRDFVNVLDVAQANYLASLYDETDVFNVGSDSCISINELLKLMLEITNISPEIKYLPKRSGDVDHCKANSEKIFKKLGFKTSIELKEGLTEYLKWYKSMSGLSEH